MCLGGFLISLFLSNTAVYSFVLVLGHQIKNRKNIMQNTLFDVGIILQSVLRYGSLKKPDISQGNKSETAKAKWRLSNTPYLNSRLPYQGHATFCYWRRRARENHRRSRAQRIRHTCHPCRCHWKIGICRIWRASKSACWPHASWKDWPTVWYLYPETCRKYEQQL